MAGRTFYIRQPNTGFVVQAPRQPDAPVYLASYSGDASQYFQQQVRPDGYSVLVNVGNGHVLDLGHSRPKPDIVTYPRHEDVHQLWKVNADSIESAYEGRVLDGRNLYLGETLLGLPPNGTQAQKFVAVYAPVPQKE